MEILREVLKTETIDLELVADLCAAGIKRKPPSERDRSKWHVSNLIESASLIARGDNRYHEYVGRPAGIMSMGRIWESAIDCYLTHYAVQQGGVYVPDMEQEQDGIVGSLDGIMILPELGMVVCETKLRFTASDEIPLKHVQQTRAYCRLADTDLVCYVSGHITSNPPSVAGFLRIIRHTAQSIAENWQMLVNTKLYLERCGCSPEYPEGKGRR